MTKEQEAQQAETIVEIKERHSSVTPENWKYIEGGAQAHDDRGKLLKIVDSQAQKIAEQAKEIERLKKEHSEFLAGIGFQP